MRLKVHQRTVAGKIIVGGINAKMGIGNSGAGHVNAVDNLLKERRRVVVGVDVVNGENGMGEKRSETHCIFNQKNQQIT